MNKSKLCLALACAVLPLSAHAGDAQLSLGVGLDYSTGKYGETQSTEIWYLPVTAKVESGKTTFKLTVPYLRITGPGGVVKDLGKIGAGGGAKTTETGLGDVVAALTYAAYENAANGLMLDVTGKIKFATADEDKGLGSGENDYAVQVDAYKTSGVTTLFGTLGYKVLGDPTGVKLDNVFYGTLGVSRKFSDLTSAGLMLDLRQKSSATGDPQREVTAYVARKLDKQWKAQAYAVKGFTDGSPDWGLGANLTYAF